MEGNIMSASTLPVAHEMGEVLYLSDYMDEKEQVQQMIHLKADGTADLRYENKDNGGKASTMDCLYTEEEIESVYNVFKRKCINAESLAKAKSNMRNLVMYVCAINIGLRVGDLCSLRWKNVFDEEWNIKSKEDFVPQKTIKRDKAGKTVSRKHITLRYNSTFKRCLLEYLKWKRFYDYEPELDDFIFTSQKEHYNEDTEKMENCIMPKEWHKVVQKVCKEAGIKQKIGTHGLRKTYGHRYYMTCENKSDALIQLMTIFGHSDMRITLGYICITGKEIEENQEKMCTFGDFETIVWDDYSKVVD